MMRVATCLRTERRSAIQPDPSVSFLADAQEVIQLKD
jgi:hypothetical protein